MEHRSLSNLLKHDHREIQELLNRLQKSTTRAKKSRETLYEKVRDKIASHSKAEERAIYPQLQNRKPSQELGFESEEEHQLVKFLLSKLDGLPVDDERWLPTLSVLKEILAHHIRVEETKGLAMLRRLFTAAELKEMGVEFESSKKGFFAPLKRLLAA